MYVGDAYFGIYVTYVHGSSSDVTGLSVFILTNYFVSTTTPAPSAPSLVTKKLIIKLFNK